MFLLFFSEPIANGMWEIWSACNCVLISHKIRSSYLEKLIIVLLHLHVTDGTWRWKSGTSGRWIKQKQKQISHWGARGWTLTSQPISRLGTVLRVPVNVQEGNRLKKIHIQDNYRNVEFEEYLFWKQGIHLSMDESESFLPGWKWACCVIWSSGHHVYRHRF